MIPCRRDGDDVIFEVHVQPGAKRPGVLGVHGGALKVGVSSPAQEGRANKALCELLGKALGVRRSAVTIVTGERRRRKVVRVAGVTAERLYALVEDVS